MSSESPTVLVIEDDRSLREVLELLLQMSGLRVVLAGNGRQALEYLQGHPPPAVILLDLMMPVMDGWQFRRQQMLHPAWAGIPVVVCSASADAEDDPGLRGIAAFFRKPFSPTDLAEAVRCHC